MCIYTICYNLCIFLFIGPSITEAIKRNSILDNTSFDSHLLDVLRSVANAIEGLVKPQDSPINIKSLVV